jgi:type I restriction enzyme S subunit
MNIADRECCIGRGLAAVRYRHDHKFIYYYLRSIERKLDEKGTGSTFRAISGEVIRNTTLFLPPLHEQQRIVAKIEELFSDLDKGIENLKTSQQQLKVYRQAVLKWAFEGKLTEKWRRTNEKTKLDLVINKILQERRDAFEIKLAQAKENKTPKPKTPKNLDNKFKINQEHLRFLVNKPNEWVPIHLAAISNNMPDSIVDGPFGSSINVENDYVESGVPVIRINNILPFLFEKTKLKYIRKEKFSELKRHNVLPGDVLFGKVGTIGNGCIYPIAEPEAMLSTTGSCRIRVDQKIISNKFLCYYLNSQKRNFNEIASAAVQAFLNMETINNFPIPLCSLKEQQLIVAEIESRLSVCDKIEETIEQSLKQAEALRQSILKKAFEGKLVPQDPSDEPASVLLERIRKERAETLPSKLQKGRRK